MNPPATTPSRLLLTVAFVIAALLVGIVGAVAAGTGTVTPPPKVAFVTTNANVAPDALTVGPMAGRLGAPLYITNADNLNEDVENALVAYGADLIIVAGGPNTVTDGVMAQIAAATGLAIKDIADTPADGIVRVAGSGRDQTAVALSELIAAYNPNFLPTDATAKDSDLLDGKDSTAFQARVSGTCGPDAAMAGVNADGGVACGATYPRTGSITVTALSGVPRFSSTVIQQASSSSHGYVGRHATSGSDYLAVGVPLPDGATVTKITSVVVDDDDTANHCFHLYTTTLSLDQQVGCSTGASATPQAIEYTTPILVDGSVGHFVYMPVKAGVVLIPIRMVFEYTLG